MAAPLEDEATAQIFPAKENQGKAFLVPESGFGCAPRASAPAGKRFFARFKLKDLL